MPNLPATAVLGVERSVRGRKWALRTHDDELVCTFTQQGLSQTTGQLLAGRGINPQDARAFLNPTLREYLPDPSTLKDMDKAAECILSALQAGKKLTVNFMDYTEKIKNFPRNFKKEEKNGVFWFD